VSLDEAKAEDNRVILVGEVKPEQRDSLIQRINQGSTAVFLNPGAFGNGDDGTTFLQLKNKGRLQFAEQFIARERAMDPSSAFSRMELPTAVGRIAAEVTFHSSPPKRSTP
jgi:hypothetical protein